MNSKGLQFEEILRMQIFYGEKDIDYNNPNGYAFLNWRFDDSMGGNNKENPFQGISDNFEMGKAYMANAVIALYSIIYSHNPQNMADTMVFPVLFSVWHGVELWLKSSIYAISLITNTETKMNQNHNIKDYLDALRERLSELNMNSTEKMALSEVVELVEEFKRVDARFDFARYSFDRKGNYQFYNAPVGDDKQWQKGLATDIQAVPNTCIKLDSLFNLILGITDHFRDFVEYLILVITEGVKLSDDYYEAHIKICKNFEKKLDDKIEEEPDPLRQIIRAINLYIL